MNIKRSSAPKEGDERVRRRLFITPRLIGTPYVSWLCWGLVWVRERYMAAEPHDFTEFNYALKWVPLALANKPGSNDTHKA